MPPARTSPSRAASAAGEPRAGGAADVASRGGAAPGAAAGRRAGGRGVAREPASWWLTTAFVLGTASVTAVSAHLVALLVDRGESAAFPAAAVGSLGAIKVGGRIASTLAERRRGMAVLTAGVFASQGAALALLGFGRGRAVVLVFVLVYGAGFGLPGTTGHVPSHPMVTTTSVVSRSSSVHRRGRSPVRSTPTSRIASTAEGFTRSAGSEPPLNSASTMVTAGLRCAPDTGSK